MQALLSINRSKLLAGTVYSIPTSYTVGPDPNYRDNASNIASCLIFLIVQSYEPRAMASNTASKLSRVMNPGPRPLIQPVNCSELCTQATMDRKCYIYYE